MAKVVPKASSGRVWLSHRSRAAVLVRMELIFRRPAPLAIAVVPQHPVLALALDTLASMGGKPRAHGARCGGALVPVAGAPARRELCALAAPEPLISTHLRWGEQRGLAALGEEEESSRNGWCGLTVAAAARDWNTSCTQNPGQQALLYSTKPHHGQL